MNEIEEALAKSFLHKMPKSNVELHKGHKRRVKKSNCDPIYKSIRRNKKKFHAKDRRHRPKRKYKASIWILCGRCCFYCRKPLTRNIGSKNQVHYDHLWPQSKGGRIIVASCFACNNQKGERLPTKKEIDRARQFGIIN